MAEVKQYQAGISVAEEQLRSYMAVSPEVCYGIITDGNELKLINKEGVEVEDIPKFDVSMLPSGIAEYIYVDFVRDKNTGICVTKNVRTNLSFRKKMRREV